MKQYCDVSHEIRLSRAVHTKKAETYQSSLGSVPVLALCYLIHVATGSLTGSYPLLLPEYHPRKFTAEYNNNFIIIFGTLTTILQVLL